MNGFAIDLVIKLTLLLGLGLLINEVLRRTAASLRYAVLLATLGASAMLPALMSVSPAWEIGVLPAQSSRKANAGISESKTRFVSEAVAPSDTYGVQTSVPAGERARSARSRPSIPDWATSLLLLWVAGTIGVLSWLAIGHVRLRKIARNSTTLNDAEWTSVFTAEKLKAGVEKDVLLLCSPDVNTPITWGVLQPLVVLPEEAFAWSDEHRRVVLGHELAHVARNDARSQLFAGVVCAAYWFHPLIWVVERKLRAECERACDDRVVVGGTAGSVYAAHLLEVARSARSFGGPGFLSVAMARTSELEGRLLAVLNESKRRDSISMRQKAIVAVFAIVLAATLSAFRPVAEHDVAPAPVLASTAPTTTGNRANAALEGVAPVSEPIKMDSIFNQSISAQPGGTLVLDFPTTGATITVSGWDEARVQVRGTLGGPSWRSTETTLQAVSNGVQLRNVYRGGSNRSGFSNYFDIKVPRRYNVQLRSAGGGITLLGLTGRFNGSTGGGEIEIQHTRGSIDLHTGGGDVHVTNSALNGSVGTGGGAVRIEGNDGNLDGDSGTGDVISSTTTTTNTRGRTVTTNGGIPTTTGTTTFITGDDPKSVARFGTKGTQIRRSGGSLSLDDAPNGARLITGGGSIRVGRSAGEVYASTGGGNIEIGPAHGSVVASTGAGDVTVVFSGGGEHAADITSGLGQVVLVLPDNFSGTLVLETAYTNNLSHKTYIRSDWPLETTETSDWDSSFGTPRRYVRTRKVFGGGAGIVRVRTVNGDIIVRRSTVTR
ncbi:MAG TPA: M56 family metallopeptidase [Gemmatimonadaceae bacterium]|nr:M56 family metallopeptidase [Gemmatimonadaceae bacterium]